jgi:hypothetical protein
MGFAKIDSSIVDSSLWFDRDARDIFVTALLMALPQEFVEDLPQLKITAFEPTGFVAPPGWYGFVRSAGIAIVDRAKIEREAGLAALVRLGEPDTESRSKKHDGRRMIRIEGGFVILNYMSFRDRDYTAADRMRRLRERQKELETARKVKETANKVEDDAPTQSCVTGESRNVTPNVTLETHNVTQAEVIGQKAEVKSHTAEKKKSPPRSGGDTPLSPAAGAFSTENDEAHMVATAVVDTIGLTTRWARDQIFEQAKFALKEHPGDLDGVRDTMITSWKEYCACAKKGKLRAPLTSPEKFFGDGKWLSSKLWGLKNGQRAYE